MGIKRLAVGVEILVGGEIEDRPEYPDGEISPRAPVSGNQRPVTADMLLRLARTYKIDLADLAGDGGADNTARMQSSFYSAEIRAKTRDRSVASHRAVSCRVCS